MIAVLLIVTFLALAAIYLVGQYRSGAFTWRDEPAPPPEAAAADSEPPALKAA